MNTTFLWKVQVCSEYDFWLKRYNFQWIRLLVERYKFAVNTTFDSKGISLQWMRLLFERYKFAVNTTFVNCTDFSDEYDFWNGTSLQWIRLFKVLQWIRLFFERYKFAVDTTFVKKGTSFQWIRLFVEKYKFAVNTTFLWTVQVWDEYDFCLKGTEFADEYDCWLKRYKFAMNTTFVWTVQVCSEYDFC